ncbi:PspC domain-containing protein [Actinomadura rayongensis]|uniref:PspC domain-containing protein n=1 Tax=Actinomadura rayongensis TaxID=1429076 RepID=A0A6I4W3W5_9ACTN|nr:PspC domain-containing protein [Actinomadura rayongensis]MXQ64857.1 PspC domain-containing protein [Actinomadura rayongensis]
MDLNKNAQRRLRRTHDGRMIGGVCSGVARYFDVDANLVRLGLAVFTLFGGAGVAAYVIGWILIPDEDARTSIGEDFVKKAQENQGVQDAVQRAKDKLGKVRS